ncbi:Hypothetical gene [Listeria ivanovii subsp. ivanovii PAM 55]|uniref:Uncharacterized protein n=1 Tax=Listeria ivanovii (strain ATCC BAA-678 / PAM 55) TaxID=881621 RepID=G2ZD01_LISIP|nr:Hypothetical gene [Listeria ivanovii subsp. ivanovii PAM 55]
MTYVDKLIELTALQTTNTLEKLDYKSNFASVIIINILLIFILNSYHFHLFRSVYW